MEPSCAFIRFNTPESCCKNSAAAVENAVFLCYNAISLASSACVYVQFSAVGIHLH